MLCSPAGNFWPGCFPGRVIFEMAPELSVAVGGVHVTAVEVLLRSAVAMISEGQLMKVGFETS